MSEVKVFHAGTLEVIDGKLVQVGCTCRDCKKVSFPQPERCMFCGSDNLEKKPLLTEGTVYSYSITRKQVGPFQPPIMGVFVDFEDGSRIYGQFHGEEEQVKKGIRVKAEVGPLWTEADGTEVMGYYYVPADGGEK